jgi:hypothetical protein
MARDFVWCERGQVLLMAPWLVGWLPEDHWVWTMLGAVDAIDVERLCEGYGLGGGGRAGYDPRMMACSCVPIRAGIGPRVGSSEGAGKDGAYKLFCAMRTPDRSTIAEFRRRHAERHRRALVRCWRCVGRPGRCRSGVITIEGTKIKANASIDQSRGYREIVNEIVREAEEIDRREDGL